MPKKRIGLNVYQPKAKNQLPLGSKHELSIARISHDGRGIAELNNKVAFVAGALAGEAVTAKLENSRGKYHELSVVNISTASTERIEPPCEYYSSCGGCSLQHWQYSAQLSHKDEVLTQRLAKLINPSTQHHHIIAGEPYHYRHRARLSIDYKKGAVQLGFQAKASNNIVAINHCAVLAPQLSALISLLQQLLSQCQGRFTAINLLLANTTDGELIPMIGLTAKLKLNQADQQLLQQFAQNHNVQLWLATGEESFVQVDSTEPLYLSNNQHNVHLHVQPDDFTQVNPAINQQLLNLVVDWLALGEQDTVADLFCGLGNFTLPMAKHCQQVVAAEFNQAMVNRLQQSAELNKVDNITAIAADLFDATTNYLNENITKVLLDPPRAGALEVCKTLAANKHVTTVVYVSCDPATLARDVEVLVNSGFSIERYVAADMFAQTAHCEAVVKLVR